jgi:hypothetical protein
MGDIPALCRHLLARIATQPGLRGLGLTDDALALLMQPTAEAIATCRQKGYGVLALGQCPQTDVLGLPLGARDLESWLLEELQEAGGPQVLLLGETLRESGELAVRLEQSRPQWQTVARAADLVQQPREMRLPALAGWDREDLRILASSSGLHHDGWLESPSRLVVQLLSVPSQAKCLKLKLYLPEEGFAEAASAFNLELDGWDQSQRVKLQSNMNIVKLDLQSQSSGYIAIALDNNKPMRFVDKCDRRLLMAVLSDVALE